MPDFAKLAAGATAAAVLSLSDPVLAQAAQECVQRTPMGWPSAVAITAFCAMIFGIVWAVVKYGMPE